MPVVPTALRRRRLTTACSLAAATALLIGGLAGCDPDEPTPPPTVASSANAPGTTANPTSAAPTPSPTPTRSSQQEKDTAAIKQAVLDFRAVTERLSMSPDADVNQLKSVAAGALLEVELNMYREWRAKGWKATKAVKIENLKVGSITAKTATATYCANSSGVDVVDRNGKSQVVEGRPDFFPKRVKLNRTKSGKWMPTGQTTEGHACDAH